MKGVEPDIKLPSPTDHPEIGESSLKGPLPYDTVDAVPFDKWDRPLFKGELKQRSLARVAADPEFRYIMEESERVKQRLAENRVSLNIDKRRQELEEETARKERRDTQREKAEDPAYKRFKLTLDTVSKPELELIGTAKKDSANGTKVDVNSPAVSAVPREDDDDDAEDAEDAVDPIRMEALNILADFVDFARSGKTAATAQATK